MPVIDGARLGLSSDDAAARRRRDGPNRLPLPERRSSVRRLLAQLVHFFAILLWVAAALAAIAGLPQLTVAIAAVVVVNGVFAFAQEERASRAADRLRALLPRNVAVRRDGRLVQVQAEDVVVGDLLLLAAGDRVPADAHVEVAHGLRIDTSMLTGESDPVEVVTGDVFAGTFVVEGDAEASVHATGSETRIAQIAELLGESESPESPLSIELRHVVRVIALISVGVGGIFLAIWSVLGNDVADGVVFAIGVTVALVPEALLPTVTLSLAWGAERMARRQVLVRQLDAVETLGSTTFICTDKTGTLTQNRMTVVATWTAPGVAEDELLRAAATCSTGYLDTSEAQPRPVGDPMEVAIDRAARDLGIDTDAIRVRSAGATWFPFDPRRRRMSVAMGSEVIAKGAPDTTLPYCDACAGVDAALDAFTARGLRVIAVASRGAGTAAPATATEAERDLHLLGLLGLEDPPRGEASDALARCRRAGIKVAMVTGDHPVTATTIAREVGLLGPAELVVCGDDLPQSEVELGALLDADGVVVARVSPEQKVRIARALRSRGHVVAMTGDGVNDGPALHEADIGIAMGVSGTDVARAAADLVLLDDSFSSIVDGVEQGRATFVNVRRFLTYHLTDNVAELSPFVVWALSGGRVPLALGVMQILALDIGTDTLSAVALGGEPPAPHLLDDPPVSGRLLDRLVLRRAFGILGPTEAAVSMGAFFASFVAAGWTPGQDFPEGDTLAAASGAAFLAVVIGQMANAYACRSSTRPPRLRSWRSNPMLPPAVLAGLTFSLVVLLVPAAARALDHAFPSTAGLLAALCAAPAVLLVDRVDKRLRARGSARVDR